MNLKKKLKISLILSLVLVLLFPTMTIFASETKSRAARENIALNKPVTSSKIAIFLNMQLMEKKIHFGHLLILVN